MKMKLPFVPSLIACLGLAAAGAAHAGVTINFGEDSAVNSPAAPAVETPGWHGDRYYDGHRMWERKDWEAHQRQVAHEHGDKHPMHEAKQHGHDDDHHD
ncbi:hypothetical protein [Trinickia violacea]|uniref:hypothetical protein n=1 Tax=Trinickia violacea TaxID=2571746 RepID=UPI001586514D|nr:hypothetical protein [Trinickia violacea]